MCVRCKCVPRRSLFAYTVRYPNNMVCVSAVCPWLGLADFTDDTKGMSDAVTKLTETQQTTLSEMEIHLRDGMVAGVAGAQGR